MWWERFRGDERSHIVIYENILIWVISPYLCAWGMYVSNVWRIRWVKELKLVYFTEQSFPLLVWSLSLWFADKSTETSSEFTISLYKNEFTSDTSKETGKSREGILDLMLFPLFFYTAIFGLAFTTLTNVFLPFWLAVCLPNHSTK